MFEWDDSGPWCLYCGHTKWHHTGFLEPGCSYLGSCRCMKYKRDTKRPKKVFTELTPKVQRRIRRRYRLSDLERHDLDF